jgi:hypothetical protein
LALAGNTPSVKEERLAKLRTAGDGLTTKKQNGENQSASTFLTTA